MQVHKSVIKRARQSIKRKIRNKKLKITMKASIKQFYNTENKEEVQKLYPSLVALLHRLAQKKIIHHKTSFRHQSRFALYINSLSK